MKKTYRSLFCLLAVLMLSVSVLPSASALFSKKLYYYGVVEGVSRTVEGKVDLDDSHIMRTLRRMTGR